MGVFAAKAAIVISHQITLGNMDGVVHMGKRKEVW
jgi:hypothetical protein